MTTRALAALLLLTLGPTAGAISTEGWPLTPEEAARLDREHQEACRRLSDILDRVEDRRKEYAAAPDKDRALSLWGAEWGGTRDVIGMLDRLQTEH